MGSTVTTKKLVLGFQTAQGLRFAAMERTYEKNVHPHTPRWGCIAIGSAEEVLRVILTYASYCEGGMLQTRSGGILPERYLSGWYRTFKQVRPLAMETVLVSLPASHEGFGLTLATLHQRNRADLVAALEAGTFSLSLHDDFELISAIYGPGKAVSPWRIIPESAGVYGDMQPADIALRPPIERPETYANPPVLSVKKYEDFLLYSLDGSPWARVSSVYGLVEELIRGPLTELEVAQPGYIEVHLPGYREQARTAESLGDPLSMEIRRPDFDAGRWQEEQYLELFQSVTGLEATEAPDTFGCTLADVASVNAQARLRYLDSKFISWYPAAAHA